MDNKNIFYIWNKYSEIQAFKKIYIFFQKKTRISAINIFTIIIIMILTIPIKFLKICYFIIKNNKWLNDSLCDLYWESLQEVKSLRIEVYKNDVHLNCHTVASLSTRLGIKNHNRPELIMKTISQIRQYRKTMMNDIPKDKSKKIYLYDSYNENMDLIQKKHYGEIEGNISWHATSNIPKNLKLTQIVEKPIVGLIKPGSLNPGTIINQEAKYYHVYGNSMTASQNSINFMKINQSSVFDISSEKLKLYRNAHTELTLIIHNSMAKHHEWDRKLVRDICDGGFDFILFEVSEYEIQTQIDHLRDID